MAYEPRVKAERLAAELHISRQALALAKIDGDMSWQQVADQLQKQIDAANYRANGGVVDPNDLDADDLPEIFSYYHKD